MDDCFAVLGGGLSFVDSRGRAKLTGSHELDFKPLYGVSAQVRGKYCREEFAEHGLIGRACCHVVCLGGDKVAQGCEC